LVPELLGVLFDLDLETHAERQFLVQFLDHPLQASDHRLHPAQENFLRRFASEALFALGVVTFGFR
jgi:hypothetical protein